MRISTTILSTLVAAGSLSASIQHAIGQQQSTPTLALESAPTAEPPAITSTAEPSAEPAPSDSAAADQPAPAATAEATSTPAQTSTAPTPAATTEPVPAPAPVEPVVVTATSDVIEYKYGVVQISLTTTDGEITNVTLLQGDASYGRDAAYAALIDATIQTQGINYGNYSGATFTTDAFKQAVTNVLGKL